MFCFSKVHLAIQQRFHQLTWEWKWKWTCSVISGSLRPHWLWPARLLPPSMGYPGKSTGLGCHFLPRGPSHPGSEPGLPHCRQTLQSEALGKPYVRLSAFNLHLRSEINWNTNTRCCSIPESVYTEKLKDFNINMPQTPKIKLINFYNDTSK